MTMRAGSVSSRAWEIEMQAAVDCRSKCTAWTDHAKRKIGG